MFKNFKTLFGAQDMTVGSPFSCLLKFAIPLLIGNMAQLLYTSADAAVVGNFMGAQGDAALAAIGTSMPIYNLFLVLFIGIGSGVTVMVSQYFGAREYEKLGESIGNSITLIALVSVAITAIATPLVGNVLHLIKAPSEMYGLAKTYLQILFIGAAANGFYNIMSGILRGLGESVFPLLVLLGTVVLNVGLDILFVAVFSMGVAGAAWATVISQILSAIICLFKVLTMKDVVKIKLRMLKLKGKIVAQFMHLGIPNAISMAIVFGATIIVQALVNKMGLTVATALTVTMRVDSFAILPSHTFSMVASTFTGQNIGAGDMDRVNKGSKTVFMMCGVFTLTMVAAMMLFGRFMIGLFTQTEEIINMGKQFITIMCPAYLAMVINQSLSGVMRGAGDSMGPMWIAMFTNVILRVPLVYIIAYFTRSETHPHGAPTSIFYALLIAMLCGAVVTFAYFKAGKWRTKAITQRKDAPIIELA